MTNTIHSPGEYQSPYQWRQDLSRLFSLWIIHGTILNQVPKASTLYLAVNVFRKTEPPPYQDDPQSEDRPDKFIMCSMARVSYE